MALILEDTALQELRRALPAEAMEADCAALLALAARAAASDAVGDAERLVQAALVLDSGHAPAWAAAAELCQRHGRLEQARTAWRRAIALAPQPGPWLLALGRLQASTGQWDEAAAIATWLALHAEDRELSEQAAALAQRVQTRAGSPAARPNPAVATSAAQRI